MNWVSGVNFQIIDGKWKNIVDMDVRLGAEIIGEFRKAFLRIGVVAKED